MDLKRKHACAVFLIASGFSFSAQARTISFNGTVKAGAAYSRAITKNLTFDLVPIDHGWEIQVHAKDRPKENLARLTPPDDATGFNDLLIESWNFTPGDTLPDGKAEIGKGGPGKIREFIFSPKVGIEIQNYRDSEPPSETDVARIRKDGHGILEMTDVKLGPALHPTAAAPFGDTIRRFDFRVKIEVP